MNSVNKIKKYFLGVFISVALLSFPLSAGAVLPPLLGFGGRSVMYWPCTCSAGIWKYFLPLYLTAIPITGPMAVSPGTFPFAWWLHYVPGVSHVGAYMPGVQACWIYAGYFCFPLPTYGVMAFTGTSLPGG